MQTLPHVSDYRLFTSSVVVISELAAPPGLRVGMHQDGNVYQTETDMVYETRFPDTRVVHTDLKVLLRR